MAFFDDRVASIARLGRKRCGDMAMSAEGHRLMPMFES
jgi:hypothetical protein